MATVNGLGIDRFIPNDLRYMFYRNPDPKYKYAISNGYSPYDFSTEGLVLYLPLWALKGSTTFQSVDAYKHICTVVGALWQPDGRLFDGDDDIITQATLFDTAPLACTYLAWVNISGDNDGAGTQYVFQKDNVTGQDRINLGILSNGSGGNVDFATEGGDSGLVNAISVARITYGTWAFIGGVYESGGNKNIVQLNATDALSAGNADTVSDGTAKEFNVGNLWTATSAVEGLVGEAWVYERALTAAERNFIRTTTMWRYQ